MMMQTWRRCFSHERLQIPLAIVKETMQPLAPIAGELLLAAAPFLPAALARWARAQEERHPEHIAEEQA